MATPSTYSATYLPSSVLGGYQGGSAATPGISSAPASRAATVGGYQGGAPAAPQSVGGLPQPSIAPRAATTYPAAAFPSTNPAMPTSGLQPLATTDGTNPGYGEQALQQTQNRLQTDPFGGQTAQLAGQAGTPSAGQNYIDQNLGTLNGPGAGEQQWNQTAGQYNNPFAGQQFTQQATAGMSPSGPATDFYNQAMNNFAQNGQYSGTNLSAQQYGQTQASFGALPTPDSADPFYDRAVQMGTQAYNQQAAGRGVYGSSETLGGVGNMVSGLEAQRAQTAFGNSMSIAQENRAREELLGNQARNSDLSSLAAFGANTAATQTYGNIANAADNSQTNRYQATTSAMNAADTNQLARMNSGADVAFRTDDANRNDFTAQTNAASQAGQLDTNRLSTAANIASQGSQNDLARLNAYNNQAQGAETQRATRGQNQVTNTQNYVNSVLGAVSDADKQAMAGDQQAFDDYYNSKILPLRQAAGWSDAQIQTDRAQVQSSFGQATAPINSAVAKG